MAMASVLQLSIALLFSTSALANGATEIASPTVAVNKQVSLECTEVDLEYSVGGVVRSTKSKDCTEKRRPVNAVVPAKNRNQSNTIVR